MPVEIEHLDFTLFADRDRVNLARLSFGGRVEWFERRFNRMAVDPLDRVRPTNRGEHEDDLWSLLVFGSVLLNAVEALGSFYSPAAVNRPRFDAFVRNFMDQAYHAHLNMLWGFRNSLAHGLTVETGSFEFFDGASVRIEKGEVQIDPDSLLQDFKAGLDAFVRKLRAAAPASSLRVNFEKRFEQRYKVPPCRT